MSNGRTTSLRVTAPPYVIKDTQTNAQLIIVLPFSCRIPILFSFRLKSAVGVFILVSLEMAFVVVASGDREAGATERA